MHGWWLVLQLSCLIVVSLCCSGDTVNLSTILTVIFYMNILYLKIKNDMHYKQWEKEGGTKLKYYAVRVETVQYMQKRKK